MDLAVSDSDVLIHLSKINQLELLQNQFSKIYISNIIYNETVVQGITLQKKDAFILKEFIQSGLILIKKVEAEKIIEIMERNHIHEGESSIIALAKEFKVNYCLTNEIKVRKIIRSEGFKVVGTLGIILKSYNLGQVDKKDCINLLKNIQSSSREFRFHPKLINKVIKEIERE